MNKIEEEVEDFYNGGTISYPQDERIRNDESKKEVEDHISQLMKSIVLDKRFLTIPPDEFPKFQFGGPFKSQEELDWCREVSIFPKFGNIPKGIDRYSFGSVVCTVFSKKHMGNTIASLPLIRNLIIYRMDIPLRDKNLLRSDPHSVTFEVLSVSTCWVVCTSNILFSVSHQFILEYLKQKRRKAFLKTNRIMDDIGQYICTFV